MNPHADTGQRPPFITFEGGDGVGKSTQIKRLAAHLEAMGHVVVLTREPGGAPGAEILRELLVSGRPGDWTPVSETLMMYAARAEHLARTINPARARGEIVLCDRFADSTSAYQGAAGGVPGELIAQLFAGVVGADGPDLTLVFDLPPEESMSRAAARAGAAIVREDRFEAKGMDFQRRVREGFLDIARRAPDRCAVIDASGSVDDVAGAVLAACDPLIENWTLGIGKK